MATCVCKSGLTGWRMRLRDIYKEHTSPEAAYDEWEHYSVTYGLAQRLGYRTARGAWNDNPIIEGSTIPTDYRISPSQG